MVEDIYTRSWEFLAESIPTIRRIFVYFNSTAAVRCYSEGCNGYGVKAKTVAMLDDFLIVAPRESGDTDSDVLKRGMTEGKVFDKLLNKLKWPIAPEKSQKSAFSTTWCVAEYFSKTRVFGSPQKK